MLLAIDAGNTNINFGIFKGSKLARRFFISTEGYSLKKLKKSLGKSKGSVDDAIICSVVPRASRVLNKDLKGLLGKRPYNIGKDIGVPIKNLYRKPAQVGQDRLVNAYAGIVFYGAPLIIVDFGTAVTFDAISKNREYLGGVILPGLEISLGVLFERTALLPKTKLAKPREFIGRDTKSSMLSGIIYGFSSLTDDLARRIKKVIGRKARVIGTGGNIGLIRRHCRRIDKIDQDLTLKGLNLIYQNVNIC